MNSYKEDCVEAVVAHVNKARMSPSMPTAFDKIMLNILRSEYGSDVVMVADGTYVIADANQCQTTTGS